MFNNKKSETGKPEISSCEGRVTRIVRMINAYSISDAKAALRDAEKLLNEVENENYVIVRPKLKIEIVIDADHCPAENTEE